MQKYKRVLIVLIVLICISTISLADKYTPSKFGSAVGNASVDTGEIKDIGGEIVGIIQVVGTAVSVGTIIFIGIKYVLGSAEEKASYKKSLLPYLVGAVLIFGATNLTQVIYDWTTESIESGEVDWYIVDTITDKYVILNYDIKEVDDDTIKEYYREVKKLLELDDFETNYAWTYNIVKEEYERRGF